MSTEQERRAEIIADYRKLLTFLAKHPEVPLGRLELNSYCILADEDEAGRAELERIAAALGVEPDFRETQWDVHRQFGTIAYRAFYCTRDSMRRHELRQDIANAAVPREPQQTAIDVEQLNRSMAAAGLRVVAGPAPLREALPDALARLGGGSGA